MTLQEYLEDKLGKMASQDPNFRERYNDNEGSSVLRCLRQVHALSRPHCQSRQQQYGYNKTMSNI